jgi:mono/diheme cytochrome c family protein
MSGSVRAAAVTLAALAVSATAPAAVTYPAGQAAFEANCAVCHQASGAGNPALAPPLLVYPAKYLSIAEGRRQLVMTVLYGLYGEITVDGSRYNFKMPVFSQLDDDVLADTLNYIAFDLGHAPSSLTPLSGADIKAVRATPSSGAEVRAHRSTVLQALGL